MEKNRITPKELGLLFLKHYPVDENGFSEIALMEELVKINPSFKTKNGCTWARSETSFLGRQFKIERVKKGNSIYSIQLVGFNLDKQNHSIPAKIRDEFKGQKCVVLDIGTSIEIDHKDARYKTEEPTLDNFQPFNKTVNDAKRQHCKECKISGCRFDAKILGSNISFTKGDSSSDFCEGCYWNDPYDFWKKTTKESLN